MKKYYVHYYRDFGNTYNLFWTDSPEMEKALPEDAERITRSKAVELAREEAIRRKENPEFAYYADAGIAPVISKFCYGRGLADWELMRLGYKKNGYIWERRKGNGND